MHSENTGISDLYRLLLPNIDHMAVRKMVETILSWTCVRKLGMEVSELYVSLSLSLYYEVKFLYFNNSRISFTNDFTFGVLGKTNRRIQISR